MHPLLKTTPESQLSGLHLDQVCIVRSGLEADLSNDTLPPLISKSSFTDA
jgi:hypothetical protein